MFRNESLKSDNDKKHFQNVLHNVLHSVANNGLMKDFSISKSFHHSKENCMIFSTTWISLVINYFAFHEDIIRIFHAWGKGSILHIRHLFSILSKRQCAFP